MTSLNASCLFPWATWFPHNRIEQTHNRHPEQTVWLSEEQANRNRVPCTDPETNPAAKREWELRHCVAIGMSQRPPFYSRLDTRSNAWEEVHSPQSISAAIRYGCFGVASSGSHRSERISSVPGQLDILVMVSCMIPSLFTVIRSSHLERELQSYTLLSGVP